VHRRETRVEPSLSGGPQPLPYGKARMLPDYRRPGGERAGRRRRRRARDRGRARRGLRRRIALARGARVGRGRSSVRRAGGLRDPNRATQGRQPLGALLPRGARAGAAAQGHARRQPAQGAHLRERTGTAARPRRGDVEHARRRGRPHPAGPILPWHSHVVCKQGLKRGLKPPASGKCPPGARLAQGRARCCTSGSRPTFAAPSRSARPSPSSAPPVLPRGACKRG
jgi:hypothetical protein